MNDGSSQPTLEPVVARPVSLIPVGLKEAALDSVSFRATVIHFGDQVDHIEKWLDNYARSISRLSQEVSHLEGLVTGFLTAAAPPTGLSEAIIDHDYTLQAAKRFGEGSQTYWGGTIQALRKLDGSMAAPIRNFLDNDLRQFKDSRRTFVETQRIYDNIGAKYYAQKKTTEASSLREDAFQLHEARKAYLKVSLDYAVTAPQIRMTLDKLLVRVFHDQSKSLGTGRNATFNKWATEMERIRGWSKEMELGERTFKRDLLSSRKQIEEDAELQARPSRELEDYNVAANVPKGPTSQLPAEQREKTRPERQSWLNVKSVSARSGRATWIRRWFFVKNGIFGWLIQDPRSGSVLESERIGILLMGVRNATNEERRFCFEIKTTDRTIVLQADNQVDMAEWMASIQLAKQKALEDPSSTDATTGNAQALDPAFAVSPPVVPEFSAVGIEGHQDDHADRVVSGGLAPTPTEPLATRGSFDVSAARRSTALEESSGRDRAERLIAKLKSDRSGTSPAGGGIASMISAAHGSMPIGPAAVPPSPIPEQHITRASTLAPRAAAAATALAALPPSTLAPSTLATPPNPTDLSAIAVMVNGEQTLSTGKIGGSTGLPSGLLANVWGSASWGFASRVERGEVKEGVSPHVETVQDYSPSAEASELDKGLPSALNGDKKKALQPSGKTSTLPIAHRKTVSLDGDIADLKRSVLTSRDYPYNYPAQLKAQDAQFKLLFPNVAPEEKVVTVFRASWSAGTSDGDQREFPGRVYVTERGVYFFSNFSGFVLVTGFNLRSIVEITSAPGRESDFIFLHLRHEKVDYSRVTIKTFLEPMKLLERRLNLLLENARAERPDTLEDLLRALTEMENDLPEQSSEGETGTPVARFGGFDGHRSNREIGARISIDRDLTGMGGVSNRDSLDIKFKLPSKPVVYTPRGMSEPVVAKDFDVSPKALFHVLFGDRSAVWQTLYHEKRAQSIKQGPWTKSDDKNHLRRGFEYTIDNVSVTDAQIIDVFNDHLCYVITDRKYPWFLPLSKSYSLVTKIVITYLSKSRCRLAVYTNIEWNKPPIAQVAKTLIDSYALRVLEPDARDLLDIAIDQVRKLGAHSHTRKAVQIFGPVGQMKTVTEFGEGSAAGMNLQYRPIKQRTLIQLFFRAWGRFIQRCTNNVLSVLWDGTRAVLGALKAQYFLLIILAGSVFFNLLYSASGASNWWSERSASEHMSRLGIGPDLLMNKAISLQDLPEAAEIEPRVPFDDHSACYRMFEQAAVEHVGPTSPSSLFTSPAAQRLRQTREQMGMFRHDLLVAMRVVNRVESEMMYSHWETWVQDETQRCAKMQALLAKQNASTVEGFEGVKGGLVEFCDSCREVEARIPKGAFF